MTFSELQGDDLGVFRNDNYRLVQCMDGHIVFSFAQKGKAMTAHIASDKKGLRYIKPAINSFCQLIFNSYNDIKMIFAAIGKDLQSMMRIVKKCGFVYIASDNKHDIYMRMR